MEAKTLKNFFDNEACVVRHAGDVFECTPSRFSAINSALKGYVEAVKKEEEQKEAQTQPKIKGFRK
jgi:hypothetical protein